MSRSKVLLETFDSQVLKSNFLRDPSTRRLPVYLPADYDMRRDQRYPVVFILTGFTGRGTMLLNDSFWDENIQERLDRLIENGQVPPLIAVMPDCSTRYGGSQYINSDGTGRYEDYIVRELVPWADERFRTIADRSQRAVMGHSSGGFGSLMLAMRHPDVFGLMACHSGDMYFELCYGSDVPHYLRSINKFGGLDRFQSTLRDIHPRDTAFYAILDMIGMASCYSPNLGVPSGFDLPFDQETGEWRSDVWSRWKSWDPICLVEANQEALKSLRLLYLDAGTRDDFNLQFGARTFTARLSKLDIPFRYEEFDDGHSNVSYRYDVSLQAMGDLWRHDPPSG